MKIATLTYQRHDNYGAMLQCYALQKKIQELGIETQIIDYVCKVSEKPFSFSALKAKGIKKYISGIIGAITRLPRKKRFAEFREKYLDMTKTYSEKDISQIGAIYDGYIVGSDNVWNSDITGMDERYFLSFVADKRKRTSYAASFGSSKIKESLEEKYKELLSQFAFLTSREKTGVELIKNLTKKDAQLVCDPTILLTKEHWSKIAIKPKIKEKYLLAYQMVPSRSFVIFVKKIAKIKGLKVIYVPFPYGLIKCRTKTRIGPLEWLGLFENAECIVTDSFHGCIFSILFKKDFLVCISQLGERIENLLSILDIKDRVIHSREDIKALPIIDYESVNKKLDELRKKSEEQLKTIISYFEYLKNSGVNGVVDPSKCTGCQLCRNICPKQAINIEKDELGFVYPKIKEEKCAHCHLCEHLCEILPSNRQKADHQCYAAINKDKMIVFNSASGGMYPTLAEAIIKKGGVVFGAGFSKGFAIKHYHIATIDDIPKLQGTKYPQSDIFNVYSEIKTLLSEKKEVLFIGTPCQCSAIKECVRFQKIDDKTLYLVDIFCNGVFSPTIWEEYVEYLENKFGKIQYVSFRDKKKGWRNKHLKVIANGKNISSYCNNKASILRMYETKIGFRESCYQCPYMCIDRVGDISIGDYWGVERVLPKLDKNKGVSAVIINNEKGQKMFEDIKPCFSLIKVDQNKILQPVLIGFNTKHPRRSSFIKDYKSSGTIGLLDKYGKVKGLAKIKRDFLVPLSYKIRIAGFISKIIHSKD